MKIVKLNVSQENSKLKFSLSEIKEKKSFTEIKGSLKALSELYKTRHSIKKRRLYDKAILSKEFGNSHITKLKNAE